MMAEDMKFRIVRTDKLIRTYDVKENKQNLFQKILDKMKR